MKYLQKSFQVPISSTLTDEEWANIWAPKPKLSPRDQGRLECAQQLEAQVARLKAARAEYEAAEAKLRGMLTMSNPVAGLKARVEHEIYRIAGQARAIREKCEDCVKT